MQVQHEVLQKRRLEKKTAMEAVKKFKKGKGELPSFRIKVVCFISAKLGVRCPQMLWWQSQ